MLYDVQMIQGIIDFRNEFHGLNVKQKIMRYLKLSCYGLLVCLLCSCEKSTDDVETAVVKAAIEELQNQKGSDAKKDLEPVQKLPRSEFKEIEWTDLMPQEDIDALLNPPSYITEIEDGSLEDQISNQLASSLEAAGDDRYQQALVSTKVIEEMNGKPIRLPGFMVPLEFDDDQTITQFFLVPFFGACIHVPPPPPNQILLVDYPEGLKVDVLYEPIRISGILETKISENDLATAAYAMRMQHYEVYVEE